MSLAEVNADQGAGSKRSEQARNKGNGRSGEIDTTERAVSVAAGAILAKLGLSRASVPGLLIAGVGGAMVYRGVTGSRLGVEESLGLTEKTDPAQRQKQRFEQGVHVRTAVLVNKPAQELYQWWRRFENLPQIMSHLESVTTQAGRTGEVTHWVAKLPSLGGKRVEWDAELTTDEPGRRVAWRSLPGAQVPNQGEVRFERALGDRGTSVIVHIDFDPPGGRLSHWLASVMGDNPKRFVREDIRNFKRLMELGELPTIEGQPHGTCTGQGKRASETAWRPFFR